MNIEAVLLGVFPDTVYALFTFVALALIDFKSKPRAVLFKSSRTKSFPSLRIARRNESETRRYSGTAIADAARAALGVKSASGFF